MEMFKSHVSPVDSEEARAWFATTTHPIPNPLLEDLSLTLSDSIAQWHQWLRYVRQDPPSLEEQQQDLIRQAQIKELARLADERWASKPSFLDKPNTRQTLPPTETSEPTVNPATESRQDAPASTPSTSTPEPAASKPKPLKEDPWAKANPGNPGDTWQPESWTPSSKR
jgi:NADH dehydrogenase [ubiquinone] 1 alpha subcomplex assembly factor 2